jgi:hypothetical protein
MPCNPFANDYLECLRQEAINSIKTQIATAILQGALSALGAKNLPQTQGINLNLSQYANLKQAYLELNNEGVFDMSMQELETWIGENS